MSGKRSSLLKAMGAVLACVCMGQARDLDGSAAALQPSGQSSAEGPTLVPQYEVQWREYSFTDISAPREDYPGVEDIDWSLEDSRLFLCHDRNYAVTRMPERLIGLKPSVVDPRPIPLLEPGPFYSALKFRQGTFFMKRDSTIYRYDSRQQRWEAHFSCRKAFTQFEVLKGDRVALICPSPLPDRTKGELPMRLGLVLNRDNEKVPLLEIYDRLRTDHPERVLPFPEPVAATLGRVNEYPLVDRSFQVGGIYLLINSRTGQIFSYDAGKQVVSPVETPWPCLDAKFLGAIDRLGLKPSWKEGMIKISQFSFPVKIHPYIQTPNEILFAVILNAICEPGYSSRRDVMEGNQGNRFAPLAKEFTREENAQWTWMKFFHYDVGSRKFTELKQPKLAALRLDFAEHWLTSAGEAIPLSSIGLGSEEHPSM